MSVENPRMPIELPELTSTQFGVTMADVSVSTGGADLMHPQLTLEGEDDAFQHTFVDGMLDVREKDSGANVVISNRGRGGSYSSISIGGISGGLIIGGGSVRINGVEISGTDNISIGSAAHRRAALLLPPNHAASHRIDTASGDVELDTLTAKVIRIASKSGDIVVRSSQVDNLTLKTMSGDVEIEDTQSPNDVSAETMSGDVDVSGSHAPSWRLSTMSGDVKVKATTGTVDASSKSGRTRIGQ